MVLCRLTFVFCIRSAIRKESSSPSTGGIMSSIRPLLVCRWNLIRWVRRHKWHSPVLRKHDHFGDWTWSQWVMQSCYVKKAYSSELCLFLCFVFVLFLFILLELVNLFQNVILSSFNQPNICKGYLQNLAWENQSTSSSCDCSCIYLHGWWDVWIFFGAAWCLQKIFTHLQHVWKLNLHP